MFQQSVDRQVTNTMRSIQQFHLHGEILSIESVNSFTMFFFAVDGLHKT
jgi:hypothetical protein